MLLTFDKLQNPPISSGNLQEVVDGENKCECCGYNFTRHDNLIKHYKKCKIKQILRQKDEDIKQLLKKKEEELKQKEDENKTLNKRLDEQTKLTTGAGNLAQTSLNIANNTLKYLENRFPNAPPLMTLDIKMIKGLEKRYRINEKLNMKIEENETDEYDLLNENDFNVDDNDNPGLFYIIKYKDDEFINVLVECIIYNFKTDDINDRSFWSTDNARRSFFTRISTIIKEEKKNIWNKDSCGVIIIDKIVIPILKFVYEEIRRCREQVILKQTNEEYIKKLTQEQIIRNIEIIEISNEILNINMERFVKQIIKRISPQFQLKN